MRAAPILLLSIACTTRIQPVETAPTDHDDAGADQAHDGPRLMPPPSFPDAGPFEVPPPAQPSGPSTGSWGGQFVDPTLPATAPMQFTGKPTTGPIPTIVYPLDGSLHPTNLADITIQWSQAGGATTYRLRLRNAAGTF